MSLPRFLLLAAIGTLLSVVGWVVVVFAIDPTQGGALGVALFFVSLFFGCLGLLFLISFFVRLAVHRAAPPFHHVGISLRQAFWVASAVTLVLLLLWYQLFAWWIGLLVVAACILFEIFFLSRSLDKRQRRTADSDRPADAPDTSPSSS